MSLHVSFTFLFICYCFKTSFSFYLLAISKKVLVYLKLLCIFSRSLYAFVTLFAWKISVSLYTFNSYKMFPYFFLSKKSLIGIYFKNFVWRAVFCNVYATNILFTNIARYYLCWLKNDKLAKFSNDTFLHFTELNR